VYHVAFVITDPGDGHKINNLGVYYIIRFEKKIYKMTMFMKLHSVKSKLRDEIELIHLPKPYNTRISYHTEMGVN